MDTGESSGPSSFGRVRCTCRYKCSQLEQGHDYVSERCRRRHLSHDKQNRCIDPIHIRRHRNATESCAPLSGDASQTNVVLQMSRQQEWRIQQSAPLRRALTGSHNLRFEQEEQPIHWSPHDSMEPPPPMQFGIHILPSRKLCLDEAIHREAWKLQALLDEAKMAQATQDKILKAFFGKCIPMDENDADYSGLELGALLRHAGVNWDGGNMGIESLSSFRGLCRTFETFGMPVPERWRICIGCSNDNWHSPEVLKPSKQDDYNISTGVKCQCTDRGTDAGTYPKSKSHLQRDCTVCSERCPNVGCGMMRKNMLRFEYFPIGPQLRKMCSSRTVCHDLQTMWREKDRWFRENPNSAPDVYREWWDGYRAKHVSYFWDPDSEFQLPVVCDNCFECYGTHPAESKTLSENWDENSQMYDFPCTDCGRRVMSSRKYAKVNSNIGRTLLYNLCLFGLFCL